MAKRSVAGRETASAQLYFAPPILLSPPVLRAAYSDRTAWIMAKASELAYIRFEDGDDRAQELKDALASGGFVLTRTFNKGGTQAYLAQSRALAVLAFRGTERDYRDILADLNVRFFKDEKGRRTHRGFSRAFARISDDIASAILSVDEGMPVYITGHSLGGALATIAAKLNPHDNVAACYTFGSPRVGSGDYDVHIKIPVYRIVNGSDIVARIPWATFGYTHVGDLRYINGAGQILRTLVPGRSGLPFLLLSFCTLLIKPLRDHRLDRYITHLAKFAEGRIEDSRTQGRMARALTQAAQAVIGAGSAAGKAAMGQARKLRASDTPLGRWLRRETAG